MDKGGPKRFRLAIGIVVEIQGGAENYGTLKAVPMVWEREFDEMYSLFLAAHIVSRNENRVNEARTFSILAGGFCGL